MSYISENDSKNDIIMKMMIEMSKLIQNLYGLVLNQHKENMRRDEHFLKFSENVYTNDYPKNRPARKLLDSQVVTKSGCYKVSSKEQLEKSR